MADNICSIGVLSNEECHQKTLTKSEQINFFQNLDENSQILLCKRTRINNKESMHTVCQHHICKYVSYYGRSQRFCCDPLNKHNRNSCSSNLREINLSMCASAEKANISLIPGKKVRIKCRSDVNKLCEKIEDESSEPSFVVVDNILPSTSKENVSYSLRPKNIDQFCTTNSKNSQNSLTLTDVNSSGSDY